MNYPSNVRSEINKYLSAVKQNMKAKSEEEVDEIIMHLQEQIDTSLEESGGKSTELENIKSILSAMS